MRFIDIIKNRINVHNRNWCGVIVGETGSGKSYSALKLGELISPDRFNIKNVCFTPEEFMNLLNRGRLRRGDAIVFDECGVGFSSRNWFQLANKMISYVLQTFRHRNLAVIFTTPNLSFVDVAGRRLFNTYFETKRINRSTNECILKVLWIQTNPLYDKSYYKRYRFHDNESRYALRTIALSLPDSDLIDDYEDKKTKFTKQLGKYIELELLTMKEKEQTKPVDIERIIKEVRKNKKKYTGKDITKKRFYLDKTMIKKDYPELSYRQVDIVKKTIENE